MQTTHLLRPSPNPTPLRLLILLAVCAWVSACGPATPDPLNPTQGANGANGANGTNGAKPAEPLVGPITNLKLKGASPTADWIEDVTTSPDGKQLHIITNDGGLWRWNLAEGKVERLRTIGDAREQTSMRPGGTLALSILGDAPRLFDATTGTEIMRFAAWKGSREAFWSPSGKHFILVNTDGTIALWNVEEQLSGYREGENLEDFLNRQEPKYQIEMDGQIRHVILTGDGHIAVAVDEGGKRGILYSGDLSKISAGDANAMKFLGRTNGDVTSLSLSPDAQSLVAINQDHGLNAVSTQKQGFAPWTKGVEAVHTAWTPTKDLLVVVTPTGSLRAFDTKLGRAMWEVPGSFQRCFNASPWFACTDGRSLSIISPEGSVPLVSLATWNDLHLLYTPDGHHWGTANVADWLSGQNNGKPVAADQWGSLLGLSAVKVSAIP
jgi:WD40 repeat protein